MTINEKNNLGDLLKYEGSNLYSREEITVASGQNLKLGTIVGRVKETDHIKQVNSEANDGSETAIGVLIEDVDASKKAAKSVIVVREAIVSNRAVVWPEEIAEEAKKEIKQDLYDRGIVIRKGA